MGSFLKMNSIYEVENFYFGKFRTIRWLLENSFVDRNRVEEFVVNFTVFSLFLKSKLFFFNVSTYT